MIRHQLPAYSPISLVQVALAFGEGLLSPGRARERLADYLKARFGADRVVLTASGTQALQLAIEYSVLGRSEADSLVALPAYACYDVVSAAVGADVQVVFYDIDPRSLTPDPESLREALKRGAKTVIAANLFGFPLDWDFLRQECSRVGATIVEDAAQGLGSSWRGKDAGSFGDLTVLSFGRGKGWTGGGGGALLWRGREQAAAVGEPLNMGGLAPSTIPSELKVFAVCVALWLLGRPSLYWLPSALPGLRLGETVYRDPIPCRRIPNQAAAIAYRHAPVAQAASADRHHWVREWDEMLTDPAISAAFHRCRPLDGGECGYLRMPVLARDAALASAVQESADACGVSRGYPESLDALPPARARGLGGGHVPVGARRLASTLLTFPTHSRVASKDVAHLRNALPESLLADPG